MPSNPAQPIAGKPCSYGLIIVQVSGRPKKCAPRTNCHATVR